MNAAETIQAAIEKLSNLRDAASGPEPWEASSEGVTSAGLPVAELEGGGCAYWSDGDRDLVVTLHATIDSQLAILRSAADQFKDSARLSFHDEPNASQLALTLADAILGEQAND